MKPGRVEWRIEERGEVKKEEGWRKERDDGAGGGDGGVERIEE